MVIDQAHRARVLRRRGVQLRAAGATGSRSCPTGGTASGRGPRSSSSPTSASTPSPRRPRRRRNPGRDLPRGIIGSLIISHGDLRRSWPPSSPAWCRGSTCHTAEPLTVAMNRYNLAWAAGIVAVGSVAAHTAVLLVFQLGQPRIFYSMARDGLLPQAFARCTRATARPTSRRSSPGVVVAAFASFANIEEMVDLTNIGTLFAFALVSRRGDRAAPHPPRGEAAVHGAARTVAADRSRSGRACSSRPACRSSPGCASPCGWRSAW